MVFAFGRCWSGFIPEWSCWTRLSRNTLPHKARCTMNRLVAGLRNDQVSMVCLEMNNSQLRSKSRHCMRQSTSYPVILQSCRTCRPGT